MAELQEELEQTTGLLNIERAKVEQSRVVITGLDAEAKKWQTQAARYKKKVRRPPQGPLPDSWLWLTVWWCSITASRRNIRRWRRASKMCSSAAMSPLNLSEVHRQLYDVLSIILPTSRSIPTHITHPTLLCTR